MNNNEHLIWKDIEGTIELQISNFGDVRTKRGYYYSPIKDRRTGYLKVRIVINGMSKQINIHRLVAQYFVPNPLNRQVVNHKNGDKENNCQWNLEWCTAEENMLHKIYVLDKNSKGENNPMYGHSGANNPKYKEPLYALDNDLNIKGVYYTQTQAAIELFNNVNIANQISRALSHKRNNLIVHGYYFLYKSEYERLKSADVKPCELLEHPELWANAYRGQSAAKPQLFEESSTTIENVDTNNVE